MRYIYVKCKRNACEFPGGTPFAVKGEIFKMPYDSWESARVTLGNIRKYFTPMSNLELLIERRGKTRGIPELP